jgi:RNA polymerase sigma-70 factor (ECF subfamily)
MALDVADAGPNPEQAEASRGERGRIDNCLGQLDADKADAVRGAYLDGYSYEELSERHKVPLNTMRTWLRRSLIKLRECLTA